MWNEIHKINFHVKLNQKSGLMQVIYRSSFDSIYFKGNFGYQSSNICINTIIKFTWNPHQDVNKGRRMLQIILRFRRINSRRKDDISLIKSLLEKSIKFHIFPRQTVKNAFETRSAVAKLGERVQWYQVRDRVSYHSSNICYQFHVISWAPRWR